LFGWGSTRQSGWLGRTYRRSIGGGKIGNLVENYVTSMRKWRYESKRDDEAV
jgi:hypothetical protein